MSTQKNYVDYRYLGDTGADDSGSIQPMGFEPVTPTTLRRAPENLRTRSEIARTAFRDLLYYRDRAQYVIQCSGTGQLSWGGTVALGGTGVVNNTTQLTLRPMLTPRANLKGSLTIGTVATNAVSYEVQAGAYETDGMNAITVEHRDVPGTVSVSCVISTGPIKRIVVVFDSTNAGHNSTVTATAVNVAIGLDAALTGKLLAVDDGVPGNAILDMAETPIDIREHAAGTAGSATADVEEHTLAANALGTFTTTNPLQEGDLVAIRYDYVIEPLGGDPDDPKGGVPGGRAESNAARGNTSVTANLFVAQSNPEWLPGAIPLVKIVNNVARWVDGTNLAAGFPAVPGSALGTNISTAGFQGAPTLAVGGGLLSTDDTVQEAFDSTDDRLGQLRAHTWHITDNSSSFGGHYNSSGGILSAIGASAGGGHLYVRRGTYSGPIVPTAVGNLVVDGEKRDTTTWSFATNTSISGRITLRNMTLARSGGVQMSLDEAILDTVTYDTGLLNFAGVGTVRMRACTMTAVNQLALPYGTTFSCANAIATDCAFTGPDGLYANGYCLGVNHTGTLEFIDCTFSLTNDSSLLYLLGAGTARRTVRFVNCTISSASAARMFWVSSAMSSTPTDIVFDNCVFTNSTGSRFLHIEKTADITVRFVNGCRFIQANSNPPAERMVHARPGEGGAVYFDDLTVYVGAGVTGSVAAFPLIDLGHTGTIAAQGRVETSRLQVFYASTAPGLHTHATVRLQESGAAATTAVRNRFAGITVDCAGKRSLLGTEPVVYGAGDGYTRKLQIESLSLRNIDYPNGGSQPLIGTTSCKVAGVRVNPVPTLSVASFPADAITFSLADVSDADLPLLRAVGAAVNVSGSSLTQQGRLRASELWLAPGGDTAQTAVWGWQYTTADDVTVLGTGTNVGTPALSYAINRGCRFYFTGSQLIDLSVVVDLQFDTCVFGFDHATGNAVLGLTAAPAALGYQVIGCRFYNANATIPSLPGPAPAGSYQAGNLFYGSAPL